MALNAKQRRSLKSFLNSIEADANDLLLCVSDDDVDLSTLVLKAEILWSQAREVRDILKS